LHFLYGFTLTACWVWALRDCRLLQRRAGLHYPVAGARGVVFMVLLLLIGGWQQLLPVQVLIEQSLLPFKTPIFVVIILLGWLFWFGFVLGVQLRRLRPVPVVSAVSPFGYRRRR
jgi:hypothetical protein